MVRELRKRKARINYASLLDDEDENEAGPSGLHQVQQEAEGIGGSDFEPDQDAEGEEDEGDEPMPPEYPSEDEVPQTPVRAGKQKSGKRAKSTTTTPGPRQMSQGASFPSIHHRHRALPIYKREMKVERLSSRPVLFQEQKTVSTNSWTANGVIADRVGKAWGYNVGSGPLWEMLEDRGWYKEAVFGEEGEDEASRRPRVYQELKLPEGWQIVDEGYAWFSKSEQRSHRTC